MDAPLACFSEVEDKVHFVYYLREAKMFCKFSEAAFSIVREGFRINLVPFLYMI